MLAAPTKPEPAAVHVPIPGSSHAKYLPNSWLRWIAAALLVSGSVTGVVLWRAHLQNAISYETVRVELGSIQAKVTATGTLNAVVDVLISSQVSGNIQGLYADWNSNVREGQLVALIDPEIFQSQVDQARATERSARSVVLTAQAQLAKTNADLSAVLASEKSAESVAAKDYANAVNAKGQWERAQMLLREQVMSQQDYDTAEANYNAAQAQVTADQAQIDATRQNTESARAAVQVARGQVESARAQRLQAKAARQQAEINFVHTKIFAPVDGVVIARRMDVGQTVASGLNPPTIFEIAQDLTKMQVDTNVDEADVGNVAAGQSAAFTVDSYPGMTFRGVVSAVRKAPIVAQNVVTYDVVIAVDNTSLKLFPGMTANVTIFTSKLDDTLYVPNSVLRFRPSAAVLKKNGLPAPQPDRQQVYVLESESLKAVPVQCGLTDGKSTALRSDQLQPGMQVVIRATPSASSTRPSPRSAPMGPRM